MHRKDLVHPSHTQVLIKSLLEAPLLVGDLAISSSFDRSALYSDQSNWSNFELNYQQKLGHLYEDVLSFLLENSRTLNLLGNGIQIFDDNKITRGEFDYILKLDGKIVHLELAVKFYLAIEKDGKTIYPGPDPRDNWENKLKRLESHQLSMSKSEFGQKLLLENYGSSEVEVQHLIYGKIFAHFAALLKNKTPALPRAVSENVEFQKWFYLSEWDDFLQDQKAFFIPKHLWPVASQQFDTSLLATLENYTKAEFTTMITEYPSCMMVWLMELEEPVFLVPDQWPQI